MSYTPWTNPLGDQGPGGNGDEVGLDWHGLNEAKGLFAVHYLRGILLWVLLDGRHENCDALRGGDTGGIGRLHRRRILTGQHGSGVDGLVLREHEGMGACSGLFRSQPLQGRTLLSSTVLHQQLKNLVASSW